MPRDVQSSMGKMPKGKKVLSRMEIEPTENDGHVVRHIYDAGTNRLGMNHEPEIHAFGNGDGQAMLEHVASHLGIETADEAKQEEQDGDGDSE